MRTFTDWNDPGYRPKEEIDRVLMAPIYKCCRQPVSDNLLLTSFPIGDPSYLPVRRQRKKDLRAGIFSDLVKYCYLNARDINAPR
jgi:hypothetical protein